MDLLWNNKQVGALGEFIAGEHLIKTGHKIIKKNYLTPAGEIDIIAEKDETLIFLEVKTRTSEYFGLPEESIVPARSRRIRKVAEIFFAEDGCYRSNARFDVISIKINRKELEKFYKDPGNPVSLKKVIVSSERFCSIKHMKDAF
jgi:putative endonuclease